MCVRRGSANRAHFCVASFCVVRLSPSFVPVTVLVRHSAGVNSADMGLEILPAKARRVGVAKFVDEGAQVLVESEGEDAAQAVRVDCGKTALLGTLRQRGHVVVEEAATRVC